MDAFLKGRSFAQAEQQHQQALEESKLQQLMLKHRLDGLKIEDQVRQRELAKQNLDLMQGQPAADMPTEAVTRQQPNLPSTNTAAGGMTGLPDVISGMVRSRLGVADQPGPGTMAAPGAQSPDLGTNPVTSQMPRAVTFPAAGNQPAVSVRPRTMEDLVRAKIAEELNKPQKLNQGETFGFPGQKPLMTGGEKAPTTTELALKAAGGDAEAAKAVNLLHPPRAGTTAASGPTLTQRAKADAWKFKELKEVERLFKESQPTYITDKTGAAVAQPGIDSKTKEEIPNAMTLDELNTAKKRIQDSYLQQIGYNPQAEAAPQTEAAAGGKTDLATAQRVLAGKKNTRVRFRDGTVWDVLPDGTVQPGPENY